MLCRNPWMSGSMPCPCGQCIPCRVNIRRITATRVMLESRVSESSCFLTLTYDDDHLPKDASLDPRHHQLFMKRLRKAVAPAALRFLCVGEYGGMLYEGSGDRLVNPHYHYALFGLSCIGPIRFAQSGKRCWCSNCELVRVQWGKGNVVLEPLTIETANYIAGYVLKKMTKIGDDRLDGRWPEFKRSSNGGRNRTGGIGAPAMEKIWNALHDSFTGEVFENEGDVPSQLAFDGKKVPLGRYLRRRLRGFYQEEVGTPQEVLQKVQKDLLDMFVAAGGTSEFLSVRDFVLKQNMGSAQLLEARVKLFQKGKTL